MPSAYTGGGRRYFSGDRFGLLGSTLGTSVVTGRLSVTRRFDLMEGRAAGVTRSVSRLRVEQILGAETARGLATVRGEMAGRQFGGAMVGSSAVTGQILIRKTLRGWPAGQASGQGTIHIEKPLVATGRGVASHQALLRVEQILGGEPVVGTSQTKGGLLIEKRLTGNLPGNTWLTGYPIIRKTLAGASEGSGTGVGALEVGKVLVGVSQGSTGAVGTLRIGAVMRASVSGSALVIGDLVIAKSLSGSAPGEATVVAEMEPPITYRRTQSEDVRATETGDVRQAERDVI